MKSAHLVKNAVVALALVGMVVAPCVAEDTRLARPTVYDAVISPASELQGQLMNSAGLPLAEQALSLVAADGSVRSTQTGADGRFVFNPATPGAYRVQGIHGEAHVRLWSRDTAPPAARQALLLVSGQGVARGQQQDSPLYAWAPWIVGGTVVAAAIVIPLAIDGDSDSGITDAS